MTYLPWVTCTDPELACIGMNEKTVKAKGISYTVWSEPFENNDRSLAEGERIGKIKMLLDEKEKPMGVQILGPQAGNLLSEWVAVMGGNVKLSTLASAVHPYPTLGEINKRVAGNFLATKIFSEKVKKTLSFFFALKEGPVGDERPDCGPRNRPPASQFYGARHVVDWNGVPSCSPNGFHKRTPFLDRNGPDDYDPL